LAMQAPICRSPPKGQDSKTVISKPNSFSRSLPVRLF
jgi:hypothetical protein